MSRRRSSKRVIPDSEDEDEPSLESEEEDQAESEELSSVEEDQVDDDDDDDEGPPPPPKLRIKLKLPTVSSNSTPTPQGDGDSGDEDLDDSEDGSASVTPALSRPMTSRQVALATGVDSGLSAHQSLEAAPSRRKKHLTEEELALRREETARKRKNLTEKRLEDEKMETINRLLKKQTRPRGKKGSTAASTPVEGGSAKPRKTKTTRETSAADDENGEGEEGAEEEELPPPPTMFRWISTSKPPVEGASEEKTQRITFSIPLNLMPAAQASVKMDVDANASTAHPQPEAKAVICDIAGCSGTRKYKFVKDPSKAACGMEHLKMIEAGHMGQVPPTT